MSSSPCGFLNIVLLCEPKELAKRIMDRGAETDDEVQFELEKVNDNELFKKYAEDFKNDYDIFEGMLIDGVLVDPSNYTVVEGSTVVTLKPEYLKTLSTGDHTLKMVYVNDLSVSADFTVVFLC